MIIYRTTVVTGLICGALAFSVPAFADCTVPNVLTNGQVADATEVMENFDAVADCADAADASAGEAVTPSGTPQTGAIAVFSGPQTITNGDLSGDVSTSGGTVTTLADTGVQPGSYVSPNITIDTKGRITNATSGSGGGGGGMEYVGRFTSTAGSVIWVQLGASDGEIYRIIVGGAANTGSNILYVQYSTDGGATYKDGSSDYYWHRADGQENSASSTLQLLGGMQSYKPVSLELLAIDFNGKGTSLPRLVGTGITLDNANSVRSDAVGGGPRSLPAGDYDSFRFAVGGGGSAVGLTVDVWRIK